MTEHAGEGTIALSIAPVYVNPGLKSKISGSVGLNFIVNGMWIAGLSNLELGVTGSAFLFPPTDFRNTDGLAIDEVHFETIQAGYKTSPQVFTVRNDGASEMDLTLTPKESLFQVGPAIDTYLSTYLSLDGTSYGRSLSLAVPANSSLDFYMYYFPPSTAKPGEKQWEVSQRDASLEDVVLLPSWLYALPISVVGAATETTNARVLVTLDYVAGQMQTDFRDLRFCLADGTELEYEQAYLIEGVECTFIVTIPILPASPSSTDFYVYSGNGLAISNATDAGLEEYNWLDGTMPPWTLEWSNPRSYIETGTIFGTSHSYYYLDSWYASYQGWISTPSTTSHGVWQIRFKPRIYSESELRFAFINNGSAENSPRYQIHYSHVGGDSLSLRYGESTVLDTASITVDTNIHILTVVRDSGGKFTVYLDDTKLLEATDTTLNSSEELWVKHWAATSNPENQHGVYVDYVNITPADVTGTITQGTWTQYALLECKAGIQYQSQEIEGIQPDIRHGCRIGGVYYE